MNREVLSPHGAFLTAYLSQRGIVSWQLSLLRSRPCLTGLGCFGFVGRGFIGFIMLLAWSFPNPSEDLKV